MDAFFHGLSECIKDHLNPLDLPLELDALISLVSKINKRLAQRDKMKNHSLCLHSGPPVPRFSPPQQSSPAATTSSASADSEEPMQIGCTKLSPKEWLRRHNKGHIIITFMMILHLLTKWSYLHIQQVQRKIYIYWNHVYDIHCLLWELCSLHNFWGNELFGCLKVLVCLNQIWQWNTEITN